MDARIAMLLSVKKNGIFTQPRQQLKGPEAVITHGLGDNLILHLVHHFMTYLFTMMIFLFNTVLYLTFWRFIIMVIKFGKNKCICTVHRGK